MNEKLKVLYPLAGLFLFALLAIGVYLWRQSQHAKERFLLQVTVVYLGDKSPITDIVVEVVTQKGRVLSRQSTNSRGEAAFRLEAGSYIVRIASGYAGWQEVDLRAGQNVRLEVLPVLQ